MSSDIDVASQVSRMISMASADTEVSGRRVSVVFWVVVHAIAALTKYGLCVLRSMSSRKGLVSINTNPQRLAYRTWAFFRLCLRITIDVIESVLSTYGS